MAALLLGTFFGVFLLSTEITGTREGAPLNLTPWPAIPIFGFLLFGYGLAGLHVAAGAGSWLADRLSGSAGRWGGLVVAALLGGTLGFFFVKDSRAILSLGLALGAVLYALALLFGTGARADGASELAVNRVAAGILVAGFIFASERAALSYHATARNESAIILVEALEGYKAVNQSYPEELGKLVPDFLPEIPRAQMGLIRDPGEAFVYSSFGDSYALEFASVQWVQCAYSPPYAFEENEIYDAEADDWGEAPDVRAGGVTEDDGLGEPGLEGSWSCETTPPKLY
jgi:hypothetical protein